MNKLPITRISLHPLKRKLEIEAINPMRCREYGFSDDMRLYSMTFETDGGKLVDLAFNFEKKHKPEILISTPYFRNNGLMEVD